MHSHVDGRGICSTNADQERAAPASERFACRTGDAAIYSKPAELQAALVEAHFNLDMRGPLEASLTRVVLGGIRLLRVEENGPRQAIFTLPQDRAVIAFPTEGARRQAWDGVMVRSGGLIFFGPGARFRHSMAGRGAWA